MSAATKNTSWSRPLSEKRVGIMLHTDGSTTDRGSRGWFEHPDCKVSYNWLYTRDGKEHEIAPSNAAAWHAGVCRTSDPQRLPYKVANHAFYGLSASATEGEVVGEAVKAAIVTRCIALFKQHGWAANETWRIVGHNQEAVFPAGHARAGQRGRKVDPEGTNRQRPVLEVAEIRERVLIALVDERLRQPVEPRVVPPPFRPIPLDLRPR